MTGGKNGGGREKIKKTPPNTLELIKRFYLCGLSNPISR